MTVIYKKKYTCNTAHSGVLEGWMMRTICNMEFLQFLQASILGPARHKGSFLGSSTDHGAAPAFTHETQFKEEVHNEKSSHQSILPQVNFSLLT